MSAKRSAGPSVLITWHNELETWGPPIDLDALYPALRHLWDGTDRGELKALLVEAWGPSPKIADPTLLAMTNAPPLSRPLTGDEVKAIEAWKNRRGFETKVTCGRNSGGLMSGIGRPCGLPKGHAGRHRTDDDENGRWTEWGEASDLRGLAGSDY